MGSRGICRKETGEGISGTGNQPDRAQRGVCTETDLGCSEPSSAICAPGEMDTRTEAGPRTALNYRLQEAEALMCRNWGPGSWAGGRAGGAKLRGRGCFKSVSRETELGARDT